MQHLDTEQYVYLIDMTVRLNTSSEITELSLIHLGLDR
jgi:hypothetical protein